jgi:hypothetical protein
VSATSSPDEAIGRLFLPALRQTKVLDAASVLRADMRTARERVR